MTNLAVFNQSRDFTNDDLKRNTQNVIALFNHLGIKK
jgi:hypothetical protein